LKIPAHAPLHLLHQADSGTLATHSREPQAGYPYPSVLPFAPDARHRPTILISRLAEHTRNLLADARAGFVAVHAPDGDVLNGQRVTLLGTFETVEATPGFTARYLRYHPDAERYLSLGDFSFWVMTPERMRYIGGFGAMGWLDGAELDPLDPLSHEDEAALIEHADGHIQRPSGLTVIGIDRYGVDLSTDGTRSRFVFEAPLEDIESLRTAVDDCIERHAL
jgi:heme iron utilization protein